MISTRTRAAALLLLTVCIHSVRAQRADVAQSGIRRRVATASVQPQAPREPRMPAGHRALQLAASLVGATFGGIGAYAAAARIADDRRVKGDEGYSPAGNAAFVGGSLLGATLGVTLTGHALRDHGSVPGALIGAALPSLILAAQVDDPYLVLYGLVLVVPLQSIGGTLGYAHR